MTSWVSQLSQQVSQQVIRFVYRYALAKKKLSDFFLQILRIGIEILSNWGLMLVVRAIFFSFFKNTNGEYILVIPVGLLSQVPKNRK